MTIDWTQRITQEQQTQQLASSLRALRDMAISETLTAEQYTELLAYRQQLRDLPSAPCWPAIEIPPPPAWLAQP
ncbi:hypothetical protein GWQ31_16250 [Aeromonas sp. 2MA4]|uniref:hypothetical protein n=1 Tax=Aeromonas sp. 2MA4 TaxID=2699195 RepID=UPI0023DDDC78|nr:hypothetical protein [Aeromonas sp. 2MA4]MDF2392894.1 hypothetical protein [Aeromonas sp. 2MA4]